jgi:hypothetical protein
MRKARLSIKTGALAGAIVSGCALGLLPSTGATAHDIAPFPVTTLDPFAHTHHSVEQLDPASGEWVEQPVWKGICMDRPARFVAPEIADSSETGAFNYRLDIGGRTLAASSASEVVADLSPLGFSEGDSVQFSYYADVARGSTVRLNYWSGGVPGTVFFYTMHERC